MPEAPFSPRLKDILEDANKGRNFVREIIKRNPDKGGQITIASNKKKSSKETNK